MNPTLSGMDDDEEFKDRQNSNNENRSTQNNEKCPPRAQAIRRQLSTNPALRPILESTVINETSSIFHSFVQESYQAELDGVLVAEEIRRFGDNIGAHRSDTTGRSSSPTSEIGKHLARLGDSYRVRYEREFREMIAHLDINQSTAYRTFAGVAKRLFRGGITWRRIVTLMAFGYQIAVDVMRSGVHGFLNRICEFIVRFISLEHIGGWISEQGGWLAALREGITSPSWAVVAGVAAAAALSVTGVLWISGYFEK